MKHSSRGPNKVYPLEKLLRSHATKIIWLLSVLLIFLGFFRLEIAPPMWWDEGWTLQVAKNWVELGHYGRLIDGEPTSARLTGSFQVIMPVAVSFQLFGVGIIQGRLPGVLVTLGAFTLIYFLSSKVYHRTIAVGVLFVLLLMPVTWELNSIMIGRQVLGEMPSLFYLLAGYILLFGAFRSSPWLVLPAGLLLGWAILTKSQNPPFVYISLFIPLGLAIYHRWWRIVVIMVATLVVSWLSTILYIEMQAWILSGITLAGEPTIGLYEVTAIVPHANVRAIAARAALTVGLPALLGYMYSAAGFLRHIRTYQVDPAVESMRLVLFTFGASWFAWYVFLGNYYARYLFPAIFIGSIFTAAFLFG